MTEQATLGKLRRQAVGEGATAFTCQRYLGHAQAKEENISWQKLEDLALGGESKPPNALQIRRNGVLELIPQAAYGENRGFEPHHRIYKS